MKKTAIALLSCAGLCSPLAAQPRLVITGIGSDLAASGNGVAGLVNVGLHNANSQSTTPAIIWSRGTGYTIIPGADRAGTESVSCSADLSALAMCTDNVTDWGSLNCFTGYSTTTGQPNPPLPPPCPPQGIAHRWSQATGWVNTGSHPRFPDPVTGRLIGGTRCDFDISSPRDISANGRHVLANGWYARATTGAGGIASGLCGNFFPYIYDGVTGGLTQLPVQPGTTPSRADFIHADGTVVTGYDLDNSQSRRRLCVWRSGVQTILDTGLGAKDNAAIAGPGTSVATGASPEFVATNFPGQSGVRLVRWTWTGSSWAASDLGVPPPYIDPNIGSPIPCSNLWATGMSDDGQTIVGNAEYGGQGGPRRPFLFRVSINEAPVDLETYINSLQPGTFPEGFSPYYAAGLSADGNAVLLHIMDQRNTCTYPGFSHTTGNAGVLYIDGSSTPCEPPRIGMGPESWDDTGGLSYGVSLNVVASGSWPLTYQWQRETSPGVWTDLQESCQNFDPHINWDYEGVYKNQLRIGAQNLGGGRGGNYRVVISNACGSIASAPAAVTFTTGACCLPNGGGCTESLQYPCLALNGTFSGPGTVCGSSCGNFCYANCDGSTIAPILNVLDFNCFLNRFSGGCP